MPHGCNDDELPWGKSSKADPLDTKVCVLRMNNFSILKNRYLSKYKSILMFIILQQFDIFEVYVRLSCRDERNHEQNFSER